MCSPALANAGLQIGQNATNFVIAEQNSRRQLAFQEARAERVAQEETENVSRQFAALSRRSLERDRRDTVEILNLQREADRARGRFRADAAAGGVEGTSVQDSINDFTAQELLRRQLISQRREAEIAGTEDQQIAIERDAERRIRAAAGGPVARPNPFQALFNIAAAGVQYYSDTNTGGSPENV